MNHKITNEERQVITKELGIIKSNTILVRAHCKDMMSDELLKALRLMCCGTRYLEQRYQYGANSDTILISQLGRDYRKLAYLLKCTDEFCDKYIQDTEMRLINIWHTA